jgi:hypothetical protein
LARIFASSLGSERTGRPLRQRQHAAVEHAAFPARDGGIAHAEARRDRTLGVAGGEGENDPGPTHEAGPARAGSADREKRVPLGRRESELHREGKHPITPCKLDAPITSITIH